MVINVGVEWIRDSGIKGEGGGEVGGVREGGDGTDYWYKPWSWPFNPYTMVARVIRIPNPACLLTSEHV